VDDSDALAKQAAAQVKAAQAAVRAAQINLGYTKITAPISGVIGRSTITEGALVSAQQATALTIIRQLSPVYVDIKRPAASLLQMKNPELSRDVRVALDDGTQFGETGKLQFADVSVDEGTGTINLRALFQNDAAALLPGMFVRAEVPSTLIDDAILVPQQAVVRQATGQTMAWVVGDDNKAQMRNIVVTRAIGNQWLLQSGLQAGERVVISGIQKLQQARTRDPIAVTPEEAKR